MPRRSFVKATLALAAALLAARPVAAAPPAPTPIAGLRYGVDDCWTATLYLGGVAGVRFHPRVALVFDGGVDASLADRDDRGWHAYTGPQLTVVDGRWLRIDTELLAGPGHRLAWAVGEYLVDGEAPDVYLGVRSTTRFLFPMGRRGGLGPLLAYEGQPVFVERTTWRDGVEAFRERFVAWRGHELGAGVGGEWRQPPGFVFTWALQWGLALSEADRVGTMTFRVLGGFAFDRRVREER